MKDFKPLLLLSGTPASGKDVLTQLLTEINPRFQHFKKHRSSDTPKTGESYTDVAPDKLSMMAEQGEFLQHHHRYGRGYGVSSRELNRHWAAGNIPIIHVGKHENICSLCSPGVTVTSVLLMVDLLETQRRLQARHTGNAEEVDRRIAAFFEERTELASLVNSGNALGFDLIINNSGPDPGSIARLIAELYVNRTH